MKVDFKQYLSKLKGIPEFLQKNMFLLGIFMIVVAVGIELGYYSVLMTDIRLRAENIDIMEEKLNTEAIDGIIEAYSESEADTEYENIFYEE